MPRKQAQHRARLPDKRAGSDSSEHSDDDSSKPLVQEKQEKSCIPAGSKANECVTELVPDDVLLGRGAPVVKYSGNVRFRALIREKTPEYIGTSQYHSKDSVARDIMAIIAEKGGRFLRKIHTLVEADHFSLPPGMQGWALVDEAVVLEKVKQAFRDNGDPSKHAASTSSGRKLKGKKVSSVSSSSTSTSPSVHSDQYHDTAHVDVNAGLPVFQGALALALAEQNRQQAQSFLSLRQQVSTIQYQVDLEARRILLAQQHALLPNSTVFSRSLLDSNQHLKAQFLARFHAQQQEEERRTMLQRLLSQQQLAMATAVGGRGGSIESARSETSEELNRSVQPRDVDGAEDVGKQTASSVDASADQDRVISGTKTSRKKTKVEHAR